MLPGRSMASVCPSGDTATDIDVPSWTTTSMAGVGAAESPAMSMRAVARIEPRNMRASSIKEILRARRPPLLFGGVPRCRDRRRIGAAPDRFERRLRAEERRGRVERELGAVHLRERRRDLEADADRPQAIAIGHQHEHAV